MKFLNPVFFFLIILLTACRAQAQDASQVTLGNGWQLQDSALVKASGSIIATQAYQPVKWYKATVPGTILTTLVNNNVYPEPLYGENNRTQYISEYLCHTSYWYRTTFTVPNSFSGKVTWLNFDGINYKAKIWINGQYAGEIKGAFARGIFNITPYVKPGETVTLAVLVSPQPNPGIPHEHNIANGMGKNGLYTSYDGPTFLCAIGWDWIPAIRDRNTGIWQKVFISSSNAVKITNPLVSTDIDLPDTTKALVKIQATVQNLTDKPQRCTVSGAFANVIVKQVVDVQPNASRLITFDAGHFPQLKLKHPKLWWPNGYGAQYLYHLTLSASDGNAVSDQTEFNFGVRKITYAVASSDNLTVSVNGQPIICKGGNWGMDDAMKRLSYKRLDAQIKMHKLANLTMIRNWVGQSTSEDFYSLCDKYGLLIWDEFFQPNPNDGPNPADVKLYLQNVREKVLRFRNHPSIAVWCARNEGYPPKEIDDSLKLMMAKLEPARLYQSSSTDGRGVRSHGPYSWRQPQDFYDIQEAFKTETGTMSIPTIESVQGMMPQKDWEEINDDWAEHDFAKGAQKGNLFPNIINERYGKIKNLADFVRKSQLMNYESYRAMYEGRFAKLFNPTTGVLTWMSHPAQPSFVWQLYHYDLEPNSSLFAVRKACEGIHVQLNEKLNSIQVVNTHTTDLPDAVVKLKIYNLDGKVLYQNSYNLNAAANKCTDLPQVNFPDSTTSIYLIKLMLFDKQGKLISDNFYWKGKTQQPGNMQQLDNIATAALDYTIEKKTIDKNCILTVKLQNNTGIPALMAHLQVHKDKSGLRALPVYYSDNYISLMPGEARQITIEVGLDELNGENPVIFIDGWNIAVKNNEASATVIKLNENAQVSHWPVTGLPFSPFNVEEK